MKIMSVLLVLVILLVLGASGISAQELTPEPTPVVEVVVEPVPVPVVDDTDLFQTSLLFIGAVLAAVMYVLDRQGKRLAELIPASVLPTINIGLQVAELLARQTASMDDDELIARIRQEIILVPPPVPITHPPEPVDMPTVDQLLQG